MLVSAIEKNPDPSSRAATGESSKCLLRQRHFEVQHNPTLSAVDRVEAGTVATRRSGHASRRVAARGLDLDHVSTHVA